MPRANIRGKDLDVITDDAAVLISIAKGEQLQRTVTCGWLTNLTGYTIIAKVVEGANVGGDLDDPPRQEESSAVITNLPIIDADPSDNQFKFVLPHDLADAWTVQPTPDDPVYGFISVSVADTGVGIEQQVFVPIRGLVEVRYNAVESV